MDAEEKLIALKKAYADIILNISKEAAVRVMSSERRAVRYQHELKTAKEEALRMLLRLKQMMDSRTSEAEAAALNQQKKIEELEAQLEEAEDIVKDLREELGEILAEMERIKKHNVQNASKPREPSRVDSYESSKLLHPNSQNEFAIASNVTTPLSHQNECSKCKEVCMCGSYIMNRDLPSIILRNKEPGLYRNGCTQRILACETDNLKDKNNSEESDKAQGEGESKLLENIKLSSFRHWKKKRAIRQRKTVAALSRKRTDLSERPDQLLELPTEHIPASVIENTQSIGEILQKDESLKEKEVSLGEKTPVRKVNAENLDMLSNGVESYPSETTKGLSSQPVRERVIKYTFQRKRKRGAVSGSETNAPPEMEKRREDVEPFKSSLVVESSRDSRRLAQVARQLISLSEKKWWH